MALISCPECGRKISDTALTCVGCGAKIRESLTKKEKEEEKILIIKDLEDALSTLTKKEVKTLTSYISFGMQSLSLKHLARGILESETKKGRMKQQESRILKKIRIYNSIGVRQEIKTKRIAKVLLDEIKEEPVMRAERYIENDQTLLLKAKKRHDIFKEKYKHTSKDTFAGFKMNIFLSPIKENKNGDYQLLSDFRAAGFGEPYKTFQEIEKEDQEDKNAMMPNLRSRYSLNISDIEFIFSLPRGIEKEVLLRYFFLRKGDYEATSSECAKELNLNHKEFLQTKISGIKKIKHHKSSSNLFKKISLIFLIAFVGIIFFISGILIKIFALPILDWILIILLAILFLPILFNLQDKWDNQN